MFQKTIISCAIFLFPWICLGQNVKTQEVAVQAEKKVYIPKNLEECFIELKKILPKEELEKFKNMPEEKAVSGTHHGLGMWIRNNWHLWGGQTVSPLAKYFNDMGIRHPDDMSGIILTSFHRHLNNKDIKLEEQRKFYKDYWEKVRQKEIK